jgi:hypothetical protein
MNPLTPTVSLFWQRLSLKKQEPIPSFNTKASKYKMISGTVLGFNLLSANVVGLQGVVGSSYSAPKEEADEYRSGTTKSFCSRCSRLEEGAGTELQQQQEERAGETATTLQQQAANGGEYQDTHHLRNSLCPVLRVSFHLVVVITGRALL